MAAMHAAIFFGVGHTQHTLRTHATWLIPISNSQSMMMMKRMTTLVPLLIGVLITIAHGEGIFSSSSNVVQLDSKSLDKDVLGGHHLWLVLFHDSQSPSKDFSSVYSETSNELQKYGVRVGALDVEKYPKDAGKFGVQQFPTLVSVEGKVTINPYTKQNLRTVQALRERTVKSLKKWALRGKGKRLPNYVIEVTNTTDFDDFQERLNTRGLNGAVLVSTKSKVSNVLKGLSSDLKDRLEIAQVGGDKAHEKLLQTLGVTMPPAKLAPFVDEEEVTKVDGGDDAEEVNLDDEVEKEEEEKKKKLEERKKKREEEEKVYEQLVEKSTTLPAIYIYSSKGKLVDEFKGDASNRDEIYTFLNGHATEEPVAPIDVEPVKKDYKEIIDLKGHKSLVDDGFREDGLLVL